MKYLIVIGVLSTICHLAYGVELGVYEERAGGSCPWNYQATMEWKVCYPYCGGMSQSPIDIPIKYLPMKSEAPAIDFKRYLAQLPAYLLKTDHNINLMIEGGVVPSISGGYFMEKFKFEQLHFHWGKTNADGSEHLVNGKAYPAEAHFVHWNTKYANIGEAADKPDGLVVLGFFLKISDKPTMGMKKIAKGFRKIKDGKLSTVDIGELSMSDILGFKPRKVADKYTYYNGSLTTPPCYESVQWHVFQRTIKVTNRIMRTFREFKKFTPNFRPVQPLNGREVLVNGVNMA